VACYGIAKAIPSIAVGGVRFVSNVFSRGCSKNAAARVAESRMAVQNFIKSGGRAEIGQSASINERLVSSPTGYANGWKGCRSYQLECAKFQSPRNASALIQGRPYSGHAIDQMQNRGIPFSVVENAVASGKAIPCKRDLCRNIYYDISNNVSVLTQRESGKVITVCHGELR
jgi:hypothetical protein